MTKSIAAGSALFLLGLVALFGRGWIATSKVPSGENSFFLQTDEILSTNILVAAVLVSLLGAGLLIASVGR